MLTNSSCGYYWWSIPAVAYGICYVIRGSITFFTVGKTVETKKLEDCQNENMKFVPCEIPEQINKEISKL